MISIAESSGGVLGEVNIFWWHYAGTGQPRLHVTTLSCPSPSPPHGPPQRFWRRADGLQAQGIDVYATHTDLDSGRGRQPVPVPGHQEEPAKRSPRQLTDWVVKSGVDGVDLDWENFAFNDGSATLGGDTTAAD